MGTQNRQRRKAKRAARAKSQREAEMRRHGATARASGDAWSWSPPHSETMWTEELVATLLQQAADASCEKSPDREFLIERLACAPAHMVARHLDYRMKSDLVLGLQNGWEPSDLFEISRRRVGALGAALACGLMQAAVAAAEAVERIDGWNVQCAMFEITRHLSVEAPDWGAQVEAAVDLVGALEQLGALSRLDEVATAASPARDPRVASVLTKIKRLLAMAESTEFADEADSFTAKAAELMLRHRIDRAAVEGSSGVSEVRRIVARRCWVEPPYLAQKSLLIQVVAEANNCKAVRHDYGFSTVVGQVEDVDMAELLFASLLVQATRQMTALGASGEETEAAATAKVQELFATWGLNGNGPPAGVTEESLAATLAELYARERRSPSFRRSFLLAYAIRIKQRFSELVRAATAAAEVELGTCFLPVLARQEREVGEAVTRLFGQLSSSRLRTTNHAGWAAGVAAADLADLNVRDELRAG